MKVIVTAGGTGGHIYPALSVIEKILSEKGNEVLYIGTKNRMESKLIPEKGIPYVGLDIYGLSKTNIPRDIKNIYLVMNSYNKCKKIMKEFKPDYVIGFGGYVTLPVLLAAHKYKIRCAIHEQNKLPGKTNRFLSKYVDTTFVSFDENNNYFKNEVILSGNPCGEKAITTKKVDKTTLGFDKNKKLIIIVMGSLGSEVVNNRLKDFITNFNDKDKEILFITGNSSYEEFSNIKNDRVKIVPFINDLSGLMSSADIIISRAGASTISEILALNKPSILIPSPYVANNHQYYNAVSLKNDNLALMLEEKDLSIPNITKNIEDLLYNKDKQIKIKNNLNKVSTLDSTKIIYDAIKELIKK